MTLEALAVKVIEAAESAGVDFMAVGAMAAGAYGVPRSTRDVDLLGFGAADEISYRIQSLHFRIGKQTSFPFILVEFDFGFP